MPRLPALITTAARIPAHGHSRRAREPGKMSTLLGFSCPGGSGARAAGTPGGGGGGWGVVRAPPLLARSVTWPAAPPAGRSRDSRAVALAAAGRRGAGLPAGAGPGGPRGTGRRREGAALGAPAGPPGHRATPVPPAARPSRSWAGRAEQRSVSARCGISAPAGAGAAGIAPGDPSFLLGRPTGRL